VCFERFESDFEEGSVKLNQINASLGGKAITILHSVILPGATPERISLSSTLLTISPISVNFLRR
jgi:hypothetical protein